MRTADGIASKLGVFITIDLIENLGRMCCQIVILVTRLKRNLYVQALVKICAVELQWFILLLANPESSRVNLNDLNNRLTLRKTSFQKNMVHKNIFAK